MKDDETGGACGTYWETRNPQNICVTELEDKRPTVKPKHTGDNNTKMDDKKSRCLLTVKTKFNNRLECVRVGESCDHELPVSISLTFQALFTK